MENIVLRPFDHNDEIAGGKVMLFDVTMDTYEDKRQRTIRVFLPASYDGVRKFPVLYMHDAQNLFDGLDNRVKWAPDKVLAQLGKEAVIVGIDTSEHRFSELCPDSPVYVMEGGRSLVREEPTGHLYAEFVVNQLRPIIEANFAVLTGPENTGIGGASMGGLMSHYMAMKYPEVFGRAMVFAPAFVAVEWEDVLNRMAAYDWDRVKGSKFYIMSGGNAVERRLFTLRSSVRVFNAMLDNGFDPDSVVLVTDSRLMHHESSWNQTFGDAFEFLFG